jgi:hypothetical protein
MSPPFGAGERGGEPDLLVGSLLVDHVDALLTTQAHRQHTVS